MRQAVWQLLEFVYRGRIAEPQPQTALPLLALATQFGLPQLARGMLAYARRLLEHSTAGVIVCAAAHLLELREDGDGDGEDDTLCALKQAGLHYLASTRRRVAVHSPKSGKVLRRHAQGPVPLRPAVPPPVSPLPCPPPPCPPRKCRPRAAAHA